jgi:methylated-DNA-protein-cysteine methyltransferase-like protein
VGRALKGCPSDLPWHRVVNAQGGISARRRVSSMLTQRILLEHEGIAFRRGRVVLGAHGWQRRGRSRRWGGLA